VHNLAIVEGLQTVQHLDEVRPDCLLADAGLFAGFSQRNFLQEVTTISMLHHNAQSLSSLLQK